MIPQSIKDALIELAETNDTIDKLQETQEFIANHYAQFEEEYRNSRTRIRHTTGKLERILFDHILNLCKWKLNNGNSSIASNILAELGYKCYVENKSCLRYKVENTLRKKRNHSRVHANTKETTRELNSTSKSTKNQKKSKTSSNTLTEPIPTLTNTFPQNETPLNIMSGKLKLYEN